MKTSVVILLLCVNLGVFAISPLKNETLLNHLSEVNKEWIKNAHLVPHENISFENDLDRIQQHLFLVIKNLKKTEHNFSEAQNQKRTKLLNVLEKYATKKVFPINLYHKERTPYFIDHLGTHCAVGYLMQQSGYENLAQKISLSENYKYVRKIKTKGVKEWAKEHGFTLDELAWIQPGYQVPAEHATIDGTTNGPVTNIENFSLNDTIYGLMFSGSFTELKGLPCLNIGYYQNDQLSCFGNGLNGKINDIVTNYGIYASGKFPFLNENYHVAKFNGETWEMIQIPNADLAEGVCVNPKNWSNPTKLLDIILFYENENKSEIWSIDTLMNYTKEAELNGRVYDINIDNNSTLVGHFDSVFIFNNNQIIDTILCNNIISYSTNYVFNNTISGPVSDTIKTIEEFFGVYYFGGTCNNFENSVCISRYSNGVMQPIVSGWYMFNMWNQDSIFSVEKIRIEQQDQKLYFSGDISCGFMYNGSGYASYNFVNNLMEPENNFDGTVYDFINYNGRIYFAGDFSSHLVRNTNSASLNEKDQTQIEIYPNPTSGILHMKGIEAGTSYQIFDVLSKTIQNGKLEHEFIDISELDAGTYLIKINSEKSNVIKTIVKN